MQYINIYIYIYIYIFIIHQIFSLARNWSKRVTWANIPQLNWGISETIPQFLKPMDNKHNKMKAIVYVYIFIYVEQINGIFDSSFYY